MGKTAKQQRRKRRERQRKRGPSKLNGQTTFVVETTAGVLVREVPSTSPLLSRDIHGDAAEDSISGAADTWGLPDFVYEPVVVEKGDAQREIGDLFVIVEGLAAVVQVKGRPKPTNAPERECSWVTKQVKRAVSQASGTLRTVERTGASLRSSRGPRLSITKSDYDWIKVVVVEHSNPPAEFGEIDFDLASDTVVLLRSDWEFLFRELRSTTGVLQYLQRAHGIGLGQHPAHYYRLAQLDEATPTSSLGFDPDDESWRVEPTPQMPLAPAGVDDGQRELLLRAIMEDAALAGIDAAVSEEDRLVTLSSLDQLPLVHRPEICHWIPSRMSDMREARRSKPDRIHVASRSFASADPSIPKFVIVACSEKASAWVTNKFSERVLAKHLTFSRMMDVDQADLRTIGVLISPAVSRSRLWDTTTLVVQGDLGLSADEEQALLDSHPMQPHDFET